MNELLTCEGLTKSYQKGTNALDDIELHIGFGRIVGLLGPQRLGQDHPHQAGQRPAAAHGGQA